MNLVYYYQMMKPYLIITSYSFPKLRYRAHAQKCKPLLHCKESIDIKVFGLQIKDEHR